MLNLSDLSKKDKQFILSTVKLFKAKKKLFYSKLKKLGWKYLANGLYKKCYYKKQFVIKCINNEYEGAAECQNECKREYQQYYRAPKKLQKHFPKIYYYSTGVIIQEKVNECDCDEGYSCKELDKITKNYSCLNDTGHNHGIDKYGTVKFFDWVYFREDEYIYSTKKLPKNKKEW